MVAIHGLNGGSISTWTHQNGHPMWLQDLLPQVLPDVRVMTFGYNASFRNFTTDQDVRSISNKLLTELLDLRKGQVVSRKHTPCNIADNTRNHNDLLFLFAIV